jgi:hypothetical protein
MPLRRANKSSGLQTQSWANIERPTTNPHPGRAVGADPRSVQSKIEHGMSPQDEPGGCPLGVSHHFHLLPEFAGKDVLRNESMDAAHDVHDLGDAEAHRNATESVSIQLTDLRLRCEET